MEVKNQWWFQAGLTYLWFTYYLAIKKEPGSPPSNFTPKQGEWKRWCKKCENYKPERTHHCKQCKKCVLKMDHHCPWTNNCVGGENVPHFLRFLVVVIALTTVVLVELSKRVIQYYEDRNLPSYLVSKREMAAVIFLFPIDLFVWLSIIILLIRCIINFFIRGMTQIEVWEKERIESQFYSERMWARIRRNYFKMHGKEMPELTSWNRTARYYEDLAQREEELQELAETQSSQDDQLEELVDLAHQDENTLVPRDFTIDDLVFPYDLGLWTNIVNFCGYPWSWVLPWGKPKNNGIDYQKNRDIEEDQLGLPWPPDGGHQEVTEEAGVDDLIDENNNVRLQDMAILRRRLDPRLNMSRKEWMNDFGETLDDFGVDVDAEDAEHEVLIK